MTSRATSNFATAPGGRHLALSIAAVVLMGVLFTSWAIRRADRHMRDDLLHMAHVVARTIPLDRLQGLSGDPSDQERPEYLRLKQQLMAAIRIDPRWNWLYLLGRKPDGSIFFFMDSGDPGSPDVSPPGQPYPEASFLLHHVFDSRSAATEGPVPDRWGTWVSAFVPLSDPKTGELACVFGIDIDASTWRARTLAAGLVPGLFSLFMLVIVVLTHLFRTRSGTAGPGHRRRERFQEAALIMATGLILTGTAVWLANSIENRHQFEAFHALAHAKTDQVLNAFRNIRNTEIESLGRYFEGSETVTPGEFDTYADFLGRIPVVQAWGWIPRVNGSARAGFETHARAEGDTGFHIWTPDTDGNPAPAPDAAAHYPLRFIAPPSAIGLFGGQPGFDLASLAAIPALLDSAARTGLPVASEIVTNLPGHDGSFEPILIFRPVHAPARPDISLGFVMAALDPHHLLQTLLVANIDWNPFIHMDLIQLPLGENPVFLASSRSPDSVPDDSDCSLTRPIFMFGHVYAVVARPTAGFMAYHSNYMGWFTLLAGLSITIATTIMVSILSHRREDMERLVEERSFELATTMRHYQILARQNRVVTWEINREAIYTAVSEMGETVFGYRPDELIGKKHIYDLAPAADRDAIRKFCEEAFLHGRPITNYVNAVLAKSGETVWVSSSAIPIHDAHGNVTGFWGTDTDITARKRAEDELARLSRQNKEAAARYQALIRASNTGAWEYHATRGQLWASPEYFQMLGLPVPADQRLPADYASIWPDRLHPDDREHALQLFRQYLQNPEGMLQQTFRMRHADGHWVWLLSRGQVLRDADGNPTPVVLGTHTDITESKRAELALLESERQYRMLTENMKDIVWTLDTDTLRFLYISPSVENLLRRTPAGIVAGSLEILFPPDRFPAFSSRIRSRAQALRDGQISSADFFVNEIDHVHADGHVVPTEAVARYWLNPQTGHVELHGVSRDISERKRAERFRELDVQTLRILGEPDELQHLLQRLTEMLQASAGFDAAAIRLRQGANYPFAAATGLSEAHLAECNNLLIHAADGRPLMDDKGRVILRCACGLALNQRSDADPAWISPGGSGWTNDLPALVHSGSDPRHSPHDHCLRSGYISIAWIPIRVRDNVIGLLQFLDRRPHRFTPDIIPILEGLAAHVGEAILRKRAEQDYRTLFRQMLEGFAVHEIICDASGTPVDYRFLDVNPAFESMTGLKAAHVVGKTVLEILPATECRWIETYGRVALTGEPAFFQDYSAALDRHFEVAAFRPAPNQFACIFSDITERKRAEVERERLMAAIEQSADTIVITDHSGAILYVNPAFSRTTGYSREEALGRNPRILQSGRHSPEFFRAMWKTLSSGSIWEGQIVNKRKNGSFYTELASISPVRDPSGRIANYVAVKRDITEQLRAQQEKEDLQAQLLQAQKMESIGRLAGGVAHDFNNMLQAILGYADMGLEEISPDHPLHADLLEIRKAAQRSTALTTQLQVFARKQAIAPQPVDLNQAIDNMAGMLRPLIGETIVWVWKPAPDLGPVMMDPGHLDQLVTNLILNARDAVAGSGRIIVSTANLDLEQPLHTFHGDIPPGPYVQLSIQDNGHGMAPDLIDHIFEPFFTTKQIGKGTGLGLATVYGILQQHHGAVRVESKLGKGTAFHVYLPRIAHAVPAPPARDAAGSASPLPHGTETILVVEDEPALLLTARRMLETLGYTVKTATGPREALRMLESVDGQVDLILTDVIMPGQNGPALVEAVHQRWPGLPHLYMSGYASNLIAEHDLAESDARFIQKPFTRSALARKVRAILDA